jgi:hypothetical protein
MNFMIQMSTLPQPFGAQRGEVGARPDSDEQSPSIVEQSRGRLASTGGTEVQKIADLLASTFELRWYSTLLTEKCSGLDSPGGSSTPKRGHVLVHHQTIRKKSRPVTSYSCI